MNNRYIKNQEYINNSDEYQEIFLRKNIKHIVQKERFPIDNLSEANLNSLNQIIHFYRSGEKMYNLSQKYYNSPDYGWLIMIVNKISNPFQLENGQPIKIIVPLESALRII